MYHAHHHVFDEPVRQYTTDELNGMQADYDWIHCTPNGELQMWSNGSVQVVLINHGYRKRSRTVEVHVGQQIVHSAIVTRRTWLAGREFAIRQAQQALRAELISNYRYCTEMPAVLHQVQVFLLDWSSPPALLLEKLEQIPDVSPANPSREEQVKWSLTTAFANTIA